jgi:hypothetical protein
MQRTVTLLLSDKRSGSTLLERELCRHSGVQHVSYTPHAHNETHYWLKAACLLRVPESEFSGGSRPGRYGSRSAIRKSLKSFLVRNVPDFEPPSTDEALVFDGWSALCRRYAAPVFFEKSPQHLHHWAALQLILDWIESTDFRVRIIGLVRNPISVQYSAWKLFHADPQRRQLGWAQAYRNVLKFRNLLDDDLFRFVRYEDLVADPATGFRALCGFIGVDHEPAVGRGVHGDSLNRWRDDARFTLQLDQRVAALAAEFGYRPEELFNPPKPVPEPAMRLRNNVVSGLRRGRSKAYNFLKRLAIQAGISD